MPRQAAATSGEIASALSRIEALTERIELLTERVNALCLNQSRGAPPPLALTIDEAAACIATSVSQFRRRFIYAGRIKCVPMGDRARAIDVDELRAAYERYKKDMREIEPGSAANEDDFG